jgi:SagB-type dehydrogenase family enzyme
MSELIPLESSLVALTLAGLVAAAQASPVLAPQAGAAAAPASIALPAPRVTGSMPVEQALAGRRSVREFARAPLSLEEVAQLLWAAQGANRPDGRRTAPSAGATYPLELLLLAGDVTGLPPGLYRYLSATHRLVRVDGRDRRAELAAAAHHQDWVARAPAVVVVAGVVARTAGRYGERAERYVAIEVGHAAQNLFLQAVALGLGSTPVGAFSDREVAALLALPEGERPYLVLPVGRPR